MGKFNDFKASIKDSANNFKQFVLKNPYAIVSYSILLVLTILFVYVLDGVDYSFLFGAFGVFWFIAYINTIDKAGCSGYLAISIANFFMFFACSNRFIITKENSSIFAFIVYTIFNFLLLGVFIAFIVRLGVYEENQTKEEKKSKEMESDLERYKKDYYESRAEWYELRNKIVELENENEQLKEEIALLKN